MSTISSFKRIENKYDIYIYEYCIKSLCEFLRKHGMKTNNFKKKSMRLLTKEHQESYEKVKLCYICKEKYENKHVKDKKYCKVRDHYHYTGDYRGAHHAFLNRSNYDNHFIIKELAEEFEKQIIEKCDIFMVPIENEVTRIDRNGEKFTKTISYRLQFIDSARFMASSLSNLFNNLSEGIQNFNVNTDMMIKNVKLDKLNLNIATVFLNTQSLKTI